MPFCGWLRQSTAVTIKVGPFLDATDGVTAEDALTLSQGDFRLSKNGGNMAQKNEATSATHDEVGMYDVALDATDTNTLGILSINVAEAGALPVRQNYAVAPANVWDSLFSTDRLQVDVREIGASVITAPSIAANAFTSGKTATGFLTANAIADDFVDKILDDPIEGSVTLRQILRGMAAALLGKASGMATTTAVLRDIGDTKDRITATVDADGNRTAVTLDLT